MSIAKYKRLRELLSAQGFTDGYKVQYLAFVDTNNLSDRFMVFRPAGGGNIDAVVSSEYYVDVILVSAAGVSNEFEKMEADVEAIISYIRDNAYADSCAGQISNMGAIPSPTITTEGRMVWMLQFSCLFGQ